MAGAVRIVLAVGLVLRLLPGCGGSGGKPTPDVPTDSPADLVPEADAGLDDSPDTGVDVPAPDEAGDPGAIDPGTPDDSPVLPDIPDTPVPDQPELLDTGTDVAVDLPVPDLPPEADAGPTCPGANGCDCASDAECASGACIRTLTDRKCSPVCTATEECATGWSCAQGREPGKWVCLFPSALCRPCVLDADCEGPGGEGACLDDGPAGRFCGVSCAKDAPCPDGFDCVEVTSSSGTAKRCVPAGGAKCPCTPFFVSEGYQTLCFQENAEGRCEAKRTCDQDCTAPVPSVELCDLFDNDCDGFIDEEDALGCKPFFADVDGDGHGVKGGKSRCLCGPDHSGAWTAPVADDCDDGDLAVHPGAIGACGGKDVDCDGEKDEPGSAGCVPYHRDVDGDGYGVAADDDPCLCGPKGEFVASKAGDCDDADPVVHPGAVEICDDKDTDCDGDTGTDATLCTNFHVDSDGDGYGLTGDFRCLCRPLAPWTAAAGGDCWDDDPDVHPGRTETCNGKDDDCDGEADPEGAEGCVNLYSDGDGDGVGTGEGRCLCGPQGIYTATATGDCDDEDKAVHPGAKEVCDGKDNDCDGKGDPVDAVGCKTFHEDSDGDGYGTIATKCLCAAAKPYTATLSGDCDDADPWIHPKAIEVCDTRDNDCDGITDPQDVPGCTSFTRDGDGDGWSNTGEARCFCAPTPPFTGIHQGDCDDTDASVHPGAEEVCNGRDDDCDGRTDIEGGEGCEEYYQDRDGDGYGDPANHSCLCQAAWPFLLSDHSDCNDDDKDVHPGQYETCLTPYDDDCDGSTNARNAPGCRQLYRDTDGDGYGTASFQCWCEPSGEYRTDTADDCDDTDPAVYPGAPEICDAKDNACNGKADPEDALGCSLYYLDLDKDGYGIDGKSKCLCAPSPEYSASLAGDCDETNPKVHPGATEYCNGRDEDCDGVTDQEGAVGCVTYYADEDGDGYGAKNFKACLCGGPRPPYTIQVGGDCDDSNPDARPGLAEKCWTPFDDNCDGQTSERDAAGCKTFYKDADHDGFGTVSFVECWCEPHGDFSAVESSDCDDTNAGIHPGAEETCNGKDDDCDGKGDAAGTPGCVQYYLDADRDGHGQPGTTLCLCGPEGSYTTTTGDDCADDDASVHPGAAEKCNGRDDDCDGVADPDGAAGCVTRYRDADKDGFGDEATKRCSCLDPGPPFTLLKGGDCDDSDPRVHPGAAETCVTPYDDDCDGSTNAEDAPGCLAWYEDQDGDGFGTEASVKCLCGPEGALVATVAGDCADGDPEVNPGATESCNSKDDDCDGSTDPEDAAGCLQYHRDSDKDGYGEEGGKCLCGPLDVWSATKAGDCAPADPAVHPGSREVCNGKDDDCDGATDPDDSDGCETFYQDLDSDGYGRTDASLCACGSGSWPFTALKPGDCADADPLVNPGTKEDCLTPGDDNCDGDPNGKDSKGCETFYLDVDGDGFGVTLAQCWCEPRANFRARADGDCDDGDAAVFPGAAETCNGKDDDCSGTADPENALGCTYWFEDKDKDGYGAGSGKCLCGPATPYKVDNADDCDDTKAGVNPEAVEKCGNKLDDDCDGKTDEGCT
jgi:hypothetical protein